MTRSYLEPLRVTGPLLSLVLRTEDVWLASSADVVERVVASIGVRSSGNLCVEEEYV